MMNISVDISHKVDPEHQKAIRQLKEILDRLGILFFIIGASARDFVLEYLHDIKAPRMTLDIDFAVRIENWDQYNEIQDELLKVPGFKKTNQKQRFKYGDTIIDIVPFGEISDDKDTISWPPEHDLLMSVSGFEDAYKYSTEILVAKDPNLEIKVPTIPGMAVMKLIAWEDSHPSRPKDAQDAFFLMLSYKKAISADRIFVDNHELLLSEDLDDEMTSIRMLGQDMAKICSIDTKDIIIEILSRESAEESDFRLVMAMINQKYEFDDVLVRLQKLRQGFEEALN